MKRSWFPIFVVAILLGLLALLATLQYRWLGQISDGDRERMQKRLVTDTERFAEDFNREIQNAYFNFQMPAAVWREQNWDEFNQRYLFWRDKTAYPNLIQDFYFVETGNVQTLTRYDRDSKKFVPAEWDDELNELKPNLAGEKYVESVAAEIPALLMPVHEAEKPFDHIFVRTRTPLSERPEKMTTTLDLPKKYGVLVIKLDADVLKNQILNDLVKKYFSESDSANYRLAVTDAQNQTVFQTGEINSSDARASLFDLSSDNYLFFANRLADPELIDKMRSGETKQIAATAEQKRTVVFARKTESLAKRSDGTEMTDRKVDLEVLSNERQPQGNVRIFGTRNSGDLKGKWTLNVQHTSGSLEQFITNTRRKNLGVSFGILSLLAVSVIFVFLSAQRAKRLAQRQMDFVSSVSHEFRTPLAVIYSAGENLTDGVVRNENQVAQYGSLIKREGKKLTGMVEQILEFAGARSGKRKYDFRPARVETILEKAVAECRPQLDEKGFALETEIAPNLRKISADENALSQAVQNLIANSLKYSDKSKSIKVTAANGNGKIKIAVEDRGIGINSKDLAHVFEPFYRAKAVVDEQIHGNGLGLSIVKQIVEAHKGEIKVESESGKGSKFTIVLPQSK